MTCDLNGVALQYVYMFTISMYIYTYVYTQKCANFYN